MPYMIMLRVVIAKYSCSKAFSSQILYIKLVLSHILVVSYPKGEDITLDLWKLAGERNFKSEQVCKSLEGFISRLHTLNERHYVSP